MTTKETELAPALERYIDEPEVFFDDGVDQESVLAQEDEPGDVLIAARLLITPTAPRTWEEALTWCAGQSADPSQNWQNLCQKFSRSAPGCPGGSATALDAFFNCPTQYRVVGGEPEDAEPGWQLVSRSRNSDSAMARFGHIFPVGRDFADGKQSGWSTDALRLGYPDRINPRDLYERWNHEYLGRIRWQNGLVVDVKEPHVAPPLQTAHYTRLADAVVDQERALRDLRAARDRAKVNEDWKDRDAIRKLIERQSVLKADTKQAYETLRRVA